MRCRRHDALWGQRWWRRSPSSGLGAPNVLSEQGRPHPSLDLRVSDCKVMGLGYLQVTPQPQFPMGLRPLTRG